MPGEFYCTQMQNYFRKLFCAFNTEFPLFLKQEASSLLYRLHSSKDSLRKKWNNKSRARCKATWKFSVAASSRERIGNRLIKTTPSAYTSQRLTGIDRRLYSHHLYLWPPGKGFKNFIGIHQKATYKLFHTCFLRNLHI